MRTLEELQRYGDNKLMDVVRYTAPEDKEAKIHTYVNDLIQLAYNIGYQEGNVQS